MSRSSAIVTPNTVIASVYYDTVTVSVIISYSQMFISLFAAASHVANTMVDICDCIITIYNI